MSIKLGKFNALQLIHFTDLTLIDISECRSVVSQDYVECIQFCTKLKHFNISECSQFHEYQMVRMLCGLQALSVVDITGTQKLQYISTYRIVTSLPGLSLICLDPKNPRQEANSWKWLITDVKHRVQFGKCVMKYFPEY